MKLTAVIVREEKLYVAHCLELGIASQGETIESAMENLKEAVNLYLESFPEEKPNDSSEVLVYQWKIQ